MDKEKLKKCPSEHEEQVKILNEQHEQFFTFPHFYLMLFGSRVHEEAVILLDTIINEARKQENDFYFLEREDKP